MAGDQDLRGRYRRGGSGDGRFVVPGLARQNGGDTACDQGNAEDDDARFLEAEPEAIASAIAAVGGNGPADIVAQAARGPTVAVGFALGGTYGGGHRIHARRVHPYSRMPPPFDPVGLRLGRGRLTGRSMRGTAGVGGSRSAGRLATHWWCTL